MLDNILQVDHLTKDYGSFTLQDVSFAIPQGCIMGFVGENGAGKTTTLKLILNLIRKDGGKVTIFGKDAETAGKDVREQIGVVFDEGYFHDSLRAGDIGKVLKRVYATWDDKEYNAYLNRFHLPVDKTVKEYSRGMKMKLAIATALAHHPKLLILDEATSGLDPVVRDEILDIFLEFIQDEEKSILFSSHIISDLEKVADYITFIHEGRVVFSRNKDELIDHYGVAHAGQADFDHISREDMVKYRKNQFGYDLLVRDRAQFSRRYPNLTVDRAAVEDIMLFYIRGTI